MQKMHTKTIKTLGLACIIISSILLAISIVGIIASLVGSAAVGSYADDYMYYQGSSGHHGYYYYDYYDYDDLYDDLYGYGSSAAGVQLALIMTILLCVFAAICCAVSLIASIITFKNAYKLEKYGLIFGWSIAGAIVGVFGSGMILTALFIIIAVFVNMDRKLYMSGQCQGVVGANPNNIPTSPAVPVMSTPSASATSPAAAAAPSNAPAATGAAATTVPVAPAAPSEPAAPSASTASSAPGAQSAQPAQNAQTVASAQTSSAQSEIALSPESSDTVAVVEGIIADGESAAPANGGASEVPVKIDMEPKDYVVEVTPSENSGNPEVAVIDVESDVSVAAEANAASTDSDVASSDRSNG